MPKRIAALTAVLVLTLTGCSGVADDAADERTAPAASETVTPEETTTPTPDVTAAPITASPEPTDLAEAPATPEDEFVAAAQNYLNGWGYWDFTNEQLLGAGLYACENTAPDLQVIEGIDPLHNAEIVTQARTILCP